MLLRNFALRACVVTGLFTAGCGAQPGTTIVTQGRTNEPVMQTAPKTGTYKLYTTLSPNATTTVRLQEGDQLGFRKDAEGRIIAVAGDNEQPLSKGTAQAYWKLQK